MQHLLKVGDQTEIPSVTTLEPTDVDREHVTQYQEREDINICEQDLDSTKALVQQIDIPNEGPVREMLQGNRNNLSSGNDTSILGYDVKIDQSFYQTQYYS